MPVDELSQDFLRVLLEYGGDADTSTIRSETGMSRGQVNHRFSKLEDKGWIEITRADSGKGERTPPKVAVLNDDGEDAIRSGKAGKKVLDKEVEDDGEDEVKVSREQLKTFHNEIDGVKNRLNVVVEQMNEGEGMTESEEGDSETVDTIDEERVEKLEREVARLRETVELLNEAVSEGNEEENKNREEQSEPQIDKDVVQGLRDQQDYLEDWMDVAQKHMVAMRMYVEDQDDDFGEYLEMADDGSR